MADAEMEVNHWFDDRCAKIYWDQHKALPYKELLRDTAIRLCPQPGERWLDLGCGGGQLAAAIWGLSRGKVGQIVAADCAAVNAEKIEALRAKVGADSEQMQFCLCDISRGLPEFATGSFDGVVSGLALCYAEWRDSQTGKFTDFAYNRLFAELQRVLKPGGKLVFSVPVPRPRFWRILWKSLRQGWKVSRPVRALVNGVRMQWYGRWLHREARRGRFHYYPIDDVCKRLESAGFEQVDHQLSFADQAYLISVRKPSAAAAAA